MGLGLRVSGLGFGVGLDFGLMVLGFTVPGFNRLNLGGGVFQEAVGSGVGVRAVTGKLASISQAYYRNLNNYQYYTILLL